MNEADDAFDLITVVMTLAVFVPIMIYCAIPFFKGDVGGFDVLIEKSARPTESEIDFEEVPIKSDDIILMLVVADRYTPEPATLRLNVAGSPTIVQLDDTFLNDRIHHLIQARQLLPAGREVDVELFSGPGGMRFWEVR